MNVLIQAMVYTIIGVILLWFGYTLFFRGGRSQNHALPKQVILEEGTIQSGYAGAPQTCPVCSTQLRSGEQVKSSVFPSFTGTDRLMHIAGCDYCLSGERKRLCPVCGDRLAVMDILVARLFEKPRRSHVHILGCNHCRKTGLPSQERGRA